ncbi:MAG: PilN domain-containing protein [Deltaproteobacteria bacterium]|nr:PilN domain-containing protein [Candidatus Tharpella sp.]
MIQINLLPVRAERRKEFIRKQLTIAVLTLLLTAAAIGFMYYQMQTKYNTTNSALQRTNKKIKQLEPVIKKIDQYKKQKQEISKKIAVIIDLDRLRLAPVIVLSDLNRLRPEKLWFTSLKESGHRLTISGVAVDNETIVMFLNNLKQSAPLKQSDLTVLRTKRIDKLELKEFTITCPLDLTSIPELLKASTPNDDPGTTSKEDQNG